MLKIKLLHPDILWALGRNGHGARILIADGNFPMSTGTPAAAKKVFLNLSPDVLMVTDILKVIKDYIPIETGIVMIPSDGSIPAVHKEFQQILGGGITLNRTHRPVFYQEVRSEDTCLAIATGDTRRFGNILIVMGSMR